MESSPRPHDGLRLAAVAWVGGARLGMWLLPFGWVRRTVPWLAERLPRRREAPPDAEAVAWAVYAARRAVPRATCLVRALGAWGLLRRWGLPAALHLGVGKGAGTRRAFHAHAWVESAGRVVVGGDVSGQVSLGTLQAPEGAQEEGPR